MNPVHKLTRLFAVVGLMAVVTESKASVPVTEVSQWNLTGKLGANAEMACQSVGLAPAETVQQAIPVTLPARNWVAKIHFEPGGTFQYFENNASLATQPIAKWPKYSGSWVQNGSRVKLTLDAKSTTSLYTIYTGGTKCGSNNPCFNKERYAFYGEIRGLEKPMLVLHQNVILKDTTIQSKGLYSCLGRWEYQKKLRSDN